MAVEYPERWNPGGVSNQSVGALLDSAAVSNTWAITHPIHHVTGTGEITDLTPPWPTFAGSVKLIPDGAATLATGGTTGSKVAKAVTMVANAVTELTFDPVTGAWYPHTVT